MELDYIKYLLNFSRIEMAVSTAGDWSILVRDECRHFDRENHLCRVHGTSEKPVTCQAYNQYQCWYRPNFASLHPRDIYVLTQDTFELWSRRISVDENGDIVSWPDFEESKEILERYEQWGVHEKSAGHQRGESAESVGPELQPHGCTNCSGCHSDEPTRPAPVWIDLEEPLAGGHNGSADQDAHERRTGRRSESLSMTHLIRATKREYQRLGRPVTESDFGDGTRR